MTMRPDLSYPRPPARSRVLAAVLSILVAGFGVILGASKQAQARPAILEIAGTPAVCQDFRGRSVVTMAVASLGDVGFARVINTVPYILLDPEVLRTLPQKLQLFFFSHECAHHVLGHWFNPTSKSEQEADCWAIRKMRDAGEITRQNVVDFTPWIRNSRGSPLGHLPGPERAEHLVACFDGP